MSNAQCPIPNKVKCLALLSGGLDSILAVKVVQDQGIEVIGVAFTTPFFGARKAEEAAQAIGLPLLKLDITEEHLSIVKAPRYGYGRNMNPCIDCHALMIRKAGEILDKQGADFIITGEVLGQRPMSQNKQSLHVVAKNSGYNGRIVRPLSAVLLPETDTEKEGLLDRGKLLDIRGRGRKRQIEMAARYGITSYSSPAGGCLLTDPMFSKRLRELFSHNPDPDPREIELLKTGRHFRIEDRVKVIVGKNRRDNAVIADSAREQDILLKVADHPGPLALIPHGCPGGCLLPAAGICVHYSDAPKDAEVEVRFRRGKETGILRTTAAPRDFVERIMI
jgi:tRNA U34 2-thiouridine synthase MnmA/TrmU